jgi:hypothetical protein
MERPGCGGFGQGNFRELFKSIEVSLMLSKGVRDAERLILWQLTLDYYLLGAREDIEGITGHLKTKHYSNSIDY